MACGLLSVRSPGVVLQTCVLARSQLQDLGVVTTDQSSDLLATCREHRLGSVAGASAGSGPCWKVALQSGQAGRELLAVTKVPKHIPGSLEALPWLEMEPWRLPWEPRSHIARGPLSR